MEVSKTYSLVTIIVDFGRAGTAVKLVKNIGATEGAIVLGRGTVRSNLLAVLGLNESRKEVVLVGIESHLESKVHEELRNELEMDKPNHGIVFSIPIKKAFGKNFSMVDSKLVEKGDCGMSYEAIFMIINKGMADKVLDSARMAGSTGGTVIHGRGSGTETTEKIFNMEIEPERDIVLILSRQEETEKIVETIRVSTGLEDAGNGIIFVLDVSKTTGLYDQNKN